MKINIFSKETREEIRFEDFSDSDLAVFIKDPLSPTRSRLDAFDEIRRREKRAADQQRRDEDEEYRNVDWPVA
jgi:hypothetical protein